MTIRFRALSVICAWRPWRQPARMGQRPKAGDGKTSAAGVPSSSRATAGAPSHGIWPAARVWSKTGRPARSSVLPPSASAAANLISVDRRQPKLQRSASPHRSGHAPSRRQYRRAQADADHANCYEDMFLFGRSLRRTPRCIELDRQVQSAKSTLGQLKSAARSAMNAGVRRAEGTATLSPSLPATAAATNMCGSMRRSAAAGAARSSPSSAMKSRDDEPSRWSATTGATECGSSTYRTLCVRECDGFYFPISTATTESSSVTTTRNATRSAPRLPSSFITARSGCGTNGLALRARRTAQMPNAFRNRKVYIRGCSCNASEYSREEIAKSEEALKTAKRADARQQQGAAGCSVRAPDIAGGPERAFRFATGECASPGRYTGAASR